MKIDGILLQTDEKKTNKNKSLLFVSLKIILWDGTTWKFIIFIANIEFCCMVQCFRVLFCK